MECKYYSATYIHTGNKPYIFNLLLFFFHCNLKGQSRERQQILYELKLWYFFRKGDTICLKVTDTRISDKISCIYGCTTKRRCFIVTGDHNS